MKELETEIGEQLFVRQSHSLKLTKNGLLFLQETTKVLQEVDKLQHLFDAQHTPLEAIKYVKVGYLDNFNMGKMYKKLGEFNQEHSDIQFSFFPDSPTNLSKGLQTGEYDLIFSLAPYTGEYAQFKTANFIENHLQIALPLSYPLNDQHQLSFSELKDETFILLDRDKSPLIVDYVLNQGILNGYNLKANHYVKNLSQGLSMTAMGNGLAFIYSAMDDGELAQKYHIKIADLTDTIGNQDIVIAINQDKENDVTQQIFESVTKEKH